jgi:hypothetical protein
LYPLKSEAWMVIIKLASNFGKCALSQKGSGLLK